MKLLLAIASAAAVWTASAQGTFEAVLNYAGDSLTYFAGTAGWTFQTTGFLTVTELGCFDYVFGANNQNPIQVGLWAPDGSLLASNTITAGSPLADQTRYESITPVLLGAGQVYHLGAFAPSNTTFTIFVNVCAPLLGGSVVTSPDIQLGAAASANGAFASPAAIPGTSGALYLGPNFRYQSGVPEPSSSLLLGLAGALLAAGRRIRRA
jgi:hypothetical protein